ncbi:hypothetical protein ACE2AJ_06080 [Aquihabitans daechungensis]|uniref:hypothetical protein n=1 Tax=Aquihabitans daechungensis TaxID=1052257 RepID=UPI003BA20E39
MTWRRTYEHRPLEPGEDPAAEDLGNIELVNSSGMQNTVAVMGLSALLLIPISWALARLKQWRAGRRGT